MPETRLLRRHPANPILTAAHFPRPVNSVFNAAVAKVDGTYLLLARVEDLAGSSCLWLARGSDGIAFTADAAPALLPTQDEPYSAVERYGIEDPRITPLEDRYYITYVGYSKYDPVTLLACTEDFRSFQRIAILTLPENKDVVLFPERINGRYARLERPTTRSANRGDIWLSFSTDLVYWGDPRPVMTPRPGQWDSGKIGAGAPPIKTAQGWLLIYHGVRATAAGQLYRLGAVLLDLEQPWRVLGRAVSAILSPSAPEDFNGNVGNVVFTCGALLELDHTLKVYYGAADQVMCLGTAVLDDIIGLCLEGGLE